MVSVIIPTYRHCHFVLRTLDSVFAQTFREFETIVINDGSPDDTREVLRPLVETGKIHYIEQKNAGQAAARNRGIAAARGEFIALLDDDDLWPPDSLERRTAALLARPDAPLAYGGVSLIDGTDAPIEENERKRRGLEVPSAAGGEVHTAFAQRNYILSPGQTLLRRSLLPEPVFDTTIWGCDDYDLYLRLAETGAFVFVEGSPTLRYRFHDANASRDFARMHLSEMGVFAAHRRRNANHPARRAAIETGMRLRRRNLAKYWLRKAARELAQSRVGAARKCLGTLWALWTVGGGEA